MKSFMTALENDELTEEEIVRGAEEIDLPFQEKADDIATLIKTITAEAEAIKAEQENLRARYQHKIISAERLKEYLKSALENLDIDRLETSRNRISFRTAQKLMIANEDMFRRSDAGRPYLKFAEPTIDKIKLKEAIKAGAQIAGVSLETNRNIQIK